MHPAQAHRWETSLLSNTADFVLAHRHIEVLADDPENQHIGNYSPSWPSAHEWVLWQTWSFSDAWPHFLPDGRKLLAVKMVACILCSESATEFQFE